MQKKIASTIFTRAASTAINFLIAVLIARHSGAAVKGDVTLMVTVTYFFVFFSNILGGQALVYLIPRNKIELLVVPAYVWGLVISVLGLVFLKATALIPGQYLIWLTLVSFFCSLLSIHQTILFAKNRITTSNLLTAVALLFQLAGILFCFYVLKIDGVWAYIYSSLVAYIFTAFISFILIKKLVPFSNFVKDFSWVELKESFRYGFKFQLVEILQLLNLRYYFFQLGLQQGSEYLGVYSVGISILEAVWIIPRSISSVHYVSTANSDELKLQAYRTVHFLKVSVLISSLALIAIACIPYSVFALVFGERFEQVTHSIRFLFPGILIYNFMLVVSSFYLGIGKYRQLIVANFAGVNALVIFSYFLIPPFVISGAGLAASLSFLVATFTLFVFFIYDTKIELSAFLFTKNDWTDLKNKIELLLHGK